jgi:hypothetical protein
MLHVQWWVWPWYWLHGQSMVAAWQPVGVALSRQAMRMVDDQQICRSFGAFQQCPHACAGHKRGCAQDCTAKHWGEGGGKAVVRCAESSWKATERGPVQADLGGVKRNAVVFCFSFLWLGA